jgi:hypothetical protein
MTGQCMGGCWYLCEKAMHDWSVYGWLVVLVREGNA